MNRAYGRKRKGRIGAKPAKGLGKTRSIRKKREGTQTKLLNGNVTGGFWGCWGGFLGVGGGVGVGGCRGKKKYGGFQSMADTSDGKAY